jgi:asparagine synthase (glutamine-hydrolysing)
VRARVASVVRWLGRSSIGATKSAALLEGIGSLPALYPPLREVLSAEQRSVLLDPAWSQVGSSSADPYRRLLEEGLSRTRRNGLSAISYAEARTYMHDVLLRDTDQMSMAHALEVRVPLLDHALAEYVMGLPDRAKRPGPVPKRLLVESLGGLLPTEIVRRPKQGFTLPMAAWMRGPLRELCEAKLGYQGLAGRGIFRPRATSGLWQDFLTGKPTVSWSRLWLLVALEVWLERQGF